MCIFNEAPFQKGSCLSSDYHTKPRKITFVFPYKTYLNVRFRVFKMAVGWLTKTR